MLMFSSSFILIWKRFNNDDRFCLQFARKLSITSKHQNTLLRHVSSKNFKQFLKFKNLKRSNFPLKPSPSLYDNFAHPAKLSSSRKSWQQAYKKLKVFSAKKPCKLMLTSTQKRLRFKAIKLPQVSLQKTQLTSFVKNIKNKKPAEVSSKFQQKHAHRLVFPEVANVFTSKGFDLFINFVMKHNRKLYARKQVLKAFRIVRSTLEKSEKTLQKSLKLPSLLSSKLLSESATNRSSFRHWLQQNKVTSSQWLFALNKLFASNIYSKKLQIKQSSMSQLVRSRSSILYYLHQMLKLIEWPLRLYYNRIGTRIVEFSRTLAPGWGLTPSLLRFVDEIRQPMYAKLPLYKRIAWLIRDILLRYHEIYKDALSVQLKVQMHTRLSKRRDDSRRLKLPRDNIEVSSRWLVGVKHKGPFMVLAP